MNNYQEAKANLWGSLAAQLEMQCGDVLSLNNLGDEDEEEEPLPNNNCRRNSLNNNGCSREVVVAPPSSQINQRLPLVADAPVASTDNINQPSSKKWKATTDTSALSNSNSLNQFQSSSSLLPSSQKPNDDNDIILPERLPTKSSILKDWIITKKVDREIKEATQHNGASTTTTTIATTTAANTNIDAALSSNEGDSTMGKFQKEHIVKCVKVAYLIVDKLERVELNNLTKEKTSAISTTTATTATNTTATDTDTATTNGNCSEAFIPTACDITQDNISIIEDEITGEVMDVKFHPTDQLLTSATTTTNNNNNTSNSNNKTNGKLGSMLGALGNLFYILFTEGESVPIIVNDVVDDFTPLSTKTTTTTDTTSTRKRKAHNSSTSSSSNNNNNNTTNSNGHKHSKRSSKNKHPEEDAIMDILLNFDMPGDSSDRKDDYIIESMRKKSSSSSSHHCLLPMHLCRFVSDLLYSSRVLEKDDPKGDDGGGRSNLHHHHHQDSIFTSIADVHSNLKQMIDFPDAFLYGTVNSRWEIVFGSNHVFGREKEMDLLMSAVRRIECCDTEDIMSKQQQEEQNQYYTLPQQRTKEVVIISGRAGTGKSLLVQDIRKPLQGRGWIFLRCKFEKKVDPDPLSVIALGFDEFFASCTALCSNDVTVGTQRCCSNGCCSRNICRKLEGLIGWIGLSTLSQLMPSLRRVLNDVYPNRNLNGGGALDMNSVLRPKHEHFFVTLLDALSQLRPVLFFTDDVSINFCTLLSHVIRCAH